MSIEQLLIILIGSIIGFLQLVILGITGWVLLEVIAHGKSIASLTTRMNTEDNLT